MNKYVLCYLMIAFIFSGNDLLAQQFDSISDIRDSRVYKIVKIGNQWWMAENLNVGTSIESSKLSYENGIIEKYCYKDRDSMCGVYGGLYTWKEMMQYTPYDKKNPNKNGGGNTIF